MRPFPKESGGELTFCRIFVFVVLALKKVVQYSIAQSRTDWKLAGIKIANAQS